MSQYTNDDVEQVVASLARVDIDGMDGDSWDRVVIHAALDYAATLRQPAARVDGVRFIAWMIDNCEGCRVTEEDLQAWLADFLRSEAALSAQPAAPQEDADLSEWLQKEIPPGTIISNPVWWAKRIAARMRTCHANNAATETADGKRQWDELASIIGANGDDVDDVLAKARALVQPAPERQGAVAWGKFVVGGEIDGKLYDFADTEDEVRALIRDHPVIDNGTFRAAPLYLHPAAPVGVPDGWKLAPVEATGDMLKAVYPLHWYESPGQRLKQDYRNLIAAAPSAPQGTQQGDFPERKWFVVTGTNRAETPILLFTSRAMAEQYCSLHPHADGYSIYSAAPSNSQGEVA